MSFRSSVDDLQYRKVLFIPRISSFLNVTIYYTLFEMHIFICNNVDEPTILSRVLSWLATVLPGHLWGFALDWARTISFLLFTYLLMLLRLSYFPPEKREHFRYQGNPCVCYNMKGLS